VPEPREELWVAGVGSVGGEQREGSSSGCCRVFPGRGRSGSQLTGRY
jgi:hypothetical protein